MSINLNINIDKNGLNNKEIKTLTEQINNISSYDIKTLLKGNSFSSKIGINGFKVTFTRNFNYKNEL